jgi:DNA-directed RNA polymerase subunit RPC12/RpoP
MSTTSFKCLNCGAGIHYNPDYGKFKCEYCMSEFTENELNKLPPQEGDDLSDDEKDRLVSYHCNSCGADVVTEDTTSATFCYYCHNPVILTERLEGEFKPKKIIPFSISKDKAKDLFMQWAGRKKYVPKDFTSDSQLEKITGIYLPHWRVEANARIDFVGEGRNTRVWRTGNTEYTETQKYEIVRKGNLEINNAGALGFDKIDARLLNGIGPYDEKNAIPFSMGYLSGFYAEQYNVPKEKVEPIVKQDLDKYFGYMVSEITAGYQQVIPQKKEMELNMKNWHFSLLPAWILTYAYKGQTYIFAVNGQSGKSFGDLPLSQGKVFSTAGLISGIVFALLVLGGVFIW